MGWNGSAQGNATSTTSSSGTGARPAHPPSRGLQKGLLALLLIAAFGGAVAWWSLTPDAPSAVSDFSRKSSGSIPSVTPSSTKPGALAEVTPAAASTTASSATNAATDSRVGTATTNSDDSPDAESQSEQPKPKAKRVFKQGTDQLIWLAVFASGDAHVPPLPHLTPEDTDRFIKSLEDPIEVDNDDPPRIRDMKEKVNETRKLIAKVMTENPDKSLSDILNEHRNAFNNGIDLHSQAQESYDQLVAEGDAEMAEKYRLKANEFLEQYGAQTIRDPAEESEETEEETNANE